MSAEITPSYMQEQAFDAILGERKYQDDKWGPTLSGGQHSNTEFLVYIQDYVNEALHYCSRNPDLDANTFTQKSMRKIAALAVAAMEQNGVWFR